MELHDKIRAKLKGGAEEKKRRDEILDAILRTAKEGGSEAVTDAMKSRLDKMERELNENLTALKKKL